MAKTKVIMGKNSYRKSKRWPIFLFSFLSIAVVAGIVIAIAYVSKFYYNWEHPIGDEALSLMGKIKFINKYFPHFNWYHQWDAGQPGFWIYLPFSFFIGASFVKFLNFTYAHSITLLGLLSYIFIAVGVYGVAYRLAKNHLTAILAAILAITSQGVWYWDGAGYYARTFGMGFYFLALWACIALMQKIEKQKKFFPLPKLEFFLTIIFFFIAAYSHSFPGYLAVGSFLVLFFVGLSGWLKKILASIFVIGTGIALSAFYYLLTFQITFLQQNKFLISSSYSPHPLRWFWNLKAFEGFSGAPEVSPLILPLVLICLIFLIISKRRFQGFESVEKKIFWVLFGFFVVSLYYPLQGSLHLPKLLYIFLPPCDAPFLVSVFGAIFIGAVLATVLRSLNKWIRYLVPIIIFCLIGMIVASQFLFTFEDKWVRNLSDGEANFLTNIKIDSETKQYRMGTTNADWAKAFNYYYDVPQSRDYFSHGIIYDDWQFWLHAAVWDKKYDYPETDYLIDWYSLKWILSTASAVDSSYDKFKARPDKYELVYKEEPNYYEFIPKTVSPILTATNVPTILVVGKEKNAYDLFVRSTALINLNSQSIIPVRGKEYIDQYNLNELQKFNIIYLYDYKYKNKEKASDLLKQYVENGGGLIVEGELSPENRNKSSALLFEPLPQTAINEYEVRGDWNFKAAENLMTKDINFNAFNKAWYENDQPWKIVVPSATTGFETLLTSNGKPVVLSKELGSGKVVWMGMNLNYHITSNKNVEEMKFFKNIINWVGQGKIDEVKAVDYEAKFVNPEQREITVESSATGILNKEYYFSAWHAYYEKDGKKINLKIYHGGLDQQYIPLPADIKYPVKVVMKYGKYPIEIVGYIVSGITFIILIIYLVYPPIIGKVWKKTFGRIKFKTASWWNKDEG